MRLFHRADGTIRALAVLAGLQLLAGVVVPLALREPLRPGAIASMGVCLTLIPLDEPSRRNRPWRQQFRSGYGIVVVAALVVWLVVVTRLFSLFR